MASIGWALLEAVLPLETWLRLELHGLAPMVVWALLLAVVGTLAVAILAAGSRALAFVGSALPMGGRRQTAPPDRGRQRIHRDTPRGGAGPRAPANGTRLHLPDPLGL